MILPRGITGFNVPKTAATVEVKVFVADCWSAVARQGGRVDDRPQILRGAHASFVSRVLMLQAGELSVLLNAVYPWVGFCEPLTPGDCSINFLDARSVAPAFAATGRYRALSAEEVERPITDDMCQELGRGELQQLKYWSGLAGRRRLRVGDVIFNFWD